MTRFPTVYKKPDPKAAAPAAADKAGDAAKGAADKAGNAANEAAGKAKEGKKVYTHSSKEASQVVGKVQRGHHPASVMV
ncbi:hypothetical protein evm_015469 [Chilo suppressalis]|nr:hypothetical protein evm_015469 [Chilo suppressalis]